MEINWPHFTKDIEIIPEVILGTLLIYALVILYNRLFGLKSLSKMTGFDFLNTLAIGNLLGMSAATSSPSLFVGAILIGLLYMINYVVSSIMFKSSRAQQIFDNSPILLMKDGRLMIENLKKTKVTKDELRGKLREANVIQLSEVRAVIFETTGDISVVHTKGDEQMDDFLMEDVKI